MGPSGEAVPIKRDQRSRIYHRLLVIGWTFVVAVSLLMNISMPRQTGLLWASFGAVWLVGLIGLSAGYAGLNRRTEDCIRAQNELLRVNSILEDQATTDPLTGIYNRRKFLELLQTQIHKSNRYKEPFVLILFDIDHFKAINDNYGHEAGDEILQELTRLVSGMIRRTDVFARFGGEEFVVLAHNEDAGEGCALAEKMRRGIHQHGFEPAGRLTCSFGVAEYLQDDTADSIIKRADHSMYSAKKKGRNLVEYACDCDTLDPGKKDTGPPVNAPVIPASVHDR